MNVFPNAVQLIKMFTVKFNVLSRDTGSFNTNRKITEVEMSSELRLQVEYCYTFL